MHGRALHRMRAKDLSTWTIRLILSLQMYSAGNFKGTRSKIKKTEVWDPEICRNDSWLENKDDIIVLIGHSTFYIRINGIQILTDPIFFDIPSIKRKSELPVDP